MIDHSSRTRVYRWNFSLRARAKGKVTKMEETKRCIATKYPPQFVTVLPRESFLVCLGRHFPLLRSNNFFRG